MRAHAVGLLAAPQRLGPGPRLPAPRRGHPRGQPQRARRRRVPPQRQRHPTLAEPFGLVHHQRPHPHVQRQPRDRVSEGEPAADLHARARLGVAAVPPQPHLDARRQRQPAAEGEAPRALQRRAHPRHPRLWKWQLEKGPLWPREKGPPRRGRSWGIGAGCAPGDIPHDSSVSTSVRALLSCQHPRLSGERSLKRGT